MLIILLISWILCSILAIGLQLQYLHLSWPRHYSGDILLFILLSLFGPATVTVLIVDFLMSGYKISLRYRRVTKEDKIAQVERKLDGV